MEAYSFDLDLNVLRDSLENLKYISEEIYLRIWILSSIFFMYFGRISDLIPFGIKKNTWEDSGNNSRKI